MLPVVILCGGQATRLYPITKNAPKSLINICGKPFIYHQLMLLKQKGASDIILCIGKFGNQIEKYVKNFDWGMNIKFSYDSDASEHILKGTGGAIKNVIYNFPFKDFFVIYGDSYLDVPYNKLENIFKERQNPLLMTVYHNEDKKHKNNIAYSKGTIYKYDKEHTTKDMEYIDYGISIMNKSIIEKIRGKTFDLSDVFKEYIRKGKVSAVEIKIPYYEIGSFEGIRKFEIHKGAIK